MMIDKRRIDRTARTCTNTSQTEHTLYKCSATTHIEGATRRDIRPRLEPFLLLGPDPSDGGQGMLYRAQMASELATAESVLYGMSA